MTKVEAQYVFTKPFEEGWLAVIERLHSVYGLQGLKLNPALDGVAVLYDASRLTIADVDRQLHAAGLPVSRAGA
jgi:hypothetical protein